MDTITILSSPAQWVGVVQSCDRVFVSTGLPEVAIIAYFGGLRLSCRWIFENFTVLHVHIIIP